MSLFRKDCPLQEFFKKPLQQSLVVGDSGLKEFISKKITKEDCLLCDYWQNNKCNYRKELAQTEKKSARGLPALTKRSVMNKPIKVRAEFEKAALRLSGLNSKEQAEYWYISQKYDQFWDKAKPKQQSDILDCLEQWQRFIESGFSPKEANERVLEWLKENSETS